MGKSKTHFEQVSLDVVKKVALGGASAPILCVLCAKPVVLEKCKIDENGMAVHQDCYVGKVAGHRLATTSKNSK
jgi:hypothetical protein